MNQLTTQTRNLRNPLPNKRAIRIKLLTLQIRIKNPKVRLGITPHRSRPLPTTVVTRQIKIQQLPSKMSLTQTIINQQMLRQKRSHHHPQSVMHPTRLVQTPHRRIHNRIPRPTLLPRRIHLLRPLTLRTRPNHRLIQRTKSRLHHPREIPQNIMIKVAPNHLRQPLIRPHNINPRINLPQRRPNQLSHRNRPKT